MCIDFENTYSCNGNFPLKLNGNHILGSFMVDCVDVDILNDSKRVF